MTSKLNRREFLMKMPPALAALYSLSGFLPSRAFGAVPSITNKFLTMVNLNGGPDMRHLFAPKPSSTPGTAGFAYWTHRSSVYGIGNDYNSWNNAFNSLYTPMTSNGVTFGFMNEAGWLKRQWDLGRVAIINNVYSTNSRDHISGDEIIQQGYTDLSSTDRDRDGFGGRIAKAVNANVVGLHGATPFCWAPHPTNQLTHTLDRVIPISNARDMGFYESNARRVNRIDNSSDSVVERALENFYQGRNMGALSKAHSNFPAYEKLFRSLGKQMGTRLAPIVTPDAIVNMAINDGNVRNEVRALYESLLCADILNLRASFLYYGGWDTHDSQIQKINSLVQDLFGDMKAMDGLFSSLEANHPTAADNMTLMFAGEFGRKLRANSARGTDHGIGNSIILVGKNVRGGTYGEMFPTSELSGGINNPFGYENGGGEIKGLTNIEHIYGVIAENIQPGIGQIVSPRMNAVSVESSGVLNNLFR